MYHYIRQDSPNNSSKRALANLAKLIASVGKGKGASSKRVTAFGLFSQTQPSAAQCESEDGDGGFSVAAWRVQTSLAFHALNEAIQREFARKADEANRRAEESAKKAMEDKWGPSDEEERGQYV